LIAYQNKEICNTLFKAQTTSHFSSYFRLSPFSIVLPFCHSNQKYEKPNARFIACGLFHLFLPIKKAV